MRFSKMDNIQADLLDFVPRERRRELRLIATVFTVAALLVLAIAYAPALAALSLYAPLFAAVMIGLLGIFAHYRQQLSIDLTVAAEFQNMLYSQALSIGSAFTLIVRRDGSIVHTSDNFADIFPQFDYSTSRALQGVFEQGSVRMLDRDRIMSAIHSGGTERLVFPIISKYADKKDYIITVEPLARPAGFSLIRGREYLGQRAGLQMLPDTLRSTSIDKLEHLLATTTTGHYTADQYGRFEYVNPAFEYMLGYEPHEIVERKLSLHHIFFSMGMQTLTEEYSITDYNGPASVVTKANGRQMVELRQTAIRDGNGKAVGATGSVFGSL